MSWQIVKLEDIFDIARGGSPRPINKYITSDSDGVNWISIKDASNSNKYITKTKLKIKKSGVSKSREVKPGDFLLTNSMSFGRPYIMKTSGCIHDGWLVLSGDDEKVDSEYFYHLLGSEMMYRKFSGLAAGAVVKNLNINLVKSVRIPLPPLKEQKRIVTILDKADAVRHKRQQAIDLTDQLLRSVFLDMFGDPVINPKGWDTGQLKDYVADGDRINYGVVQPGSDFENGIPLVRAGDISNMAVGTDKLKLIDPEIEKSYKRSRLHGDEVLIACVGSIGNVALAGEIHKGFNIARAVARVRFNDQVNRVFGAYMLSCPSVQAYFTKETRTVAQPTLNIKQITETSIIVPPIEKQLAFAEKVKLLNKIILEKTKSKNSLNELFNSLTQQAFNGELGKQSKAA